MDVLPGDFVDLPFTLNVFTIIVSLAAVYYWVKLFKRISISDRRDEGWMWIFASVLMVLLLNVSTMLLVSTSGRIPVDSYRVFVVDVKTLEFVNAFSRTVMALSMTIGAYMLYKSMRSRGDVKFMFSPVEHVMEDSSTSEQKFDLKSGCSYLVSADQEDGSVSGWDLFVDLVTHGTMGLVVSRHHPPELRDRYGLVKTPMVWLTQEKVDDSLHPSDLTELSHIIKEFIWKGGETAVLLDGIEYLVLHNSFEDVLKTIQGVDDVVVQNKSCLILTIDPSAVSEQEFHLLKRELNEYMA
ncbi:MAG: DUF835 domain-containing protein [Candidatus Altiarchaeales archaeon]|nr:DUF835 domain-containing protein [Candidatus Altiarchaeales archaeon]MBD3415956.1 DUF835 domain-containing protein [Candidatus Altiarchaeales archaeon]